MTDFRPERGSYEPLPAQNAEQFAANEYPGETKHIPVGEYPQQGEAYPQQGEAYPRQGGQPSFEAGSYEPLWAEEAPQPGFSAAEKVAPYAQEEYRSGRSDAEAGGWGRGVSGLRDLFFYAAMEDDEDEEEDRRGRRSIFKKRRRKPSFVLGVIINSLRLLLLLVLLFGLSGVGAVIGIAKAYVDAAPELDLTVFDNQAQTSFIYDALGNEICQYKGTENRVQVDIRAIPMQLRNAFVAVEDARFYTHNGVDIKRIFGSAFANLTTGSNQGGSTITQQLIKNTLLSPEQSYKRKIQEAYLAMQLENKYTKDQILQCYLNTIYLGEDYYGVQTAATGYFGKSNLNELTLRECAMLAGMARSPYYYNCRSNYYLRHSEETDYRKITDDRTDYVLRCMYENGFISRTDYEMALSPESARVLEKAPDSGSMYKYPHYVEYAIRDVIRALLELNGLEDTSKNRNKMENELRTGGYHVWLALDTAIQETVEETLKGFSDYPTLREPSDKIYRARNADGTYE